MGNIKVGDKWIKKIDRANHKLEFTDKQSEAYDRDGSWYLDAEINYLKFHFKDEYPEVENARPVLKGGD